MLPWTSIHVDRDDEWLAKLWEIGGFERLFVMSWDQRVILGIRASVKLEGILFLTGFGDAR